MISDQRGEVYVFIAICDDPQAPLLRMRVLGSADKDNYNNNSSTSTCWLPLLLLRQLGGLVVALCDPLTTWKGEINKRRGHAQSAKNLSDHGHVAH